VSGAASPAGVVRALWERMEARDWDGARATLDDGYSATWPASGEVFPSADAYIAMNRAYPEGWHITVDETVADGGRVAARIRVTLGEALFHCLSFAEVAGGLIARSVDFWVDDRGDDAPDWRAPFRLPQEPA
jgi:hypothetical protein